MSTSKIVREGMVTPWGAADHAEILAPGVGRVSTPSHGGIKLSPAKNKKVPEPLRNPDGWYEEDCEANIPLAVFPDVLPEVDRNRVHEQLHYWFPDKHEAAYPERKSMFTGQETANDVLDRLRAEQAEREQAYDDAAEEIAFQEAQAAADDGSKCDKCKGFGLVRGVGKHAGDPYKTLNGAQQALAGGRAVDCPKCSGAGLIGVVA